MNDVQIPDDEAARIDVLRRYGILDVPSDAVLDSITQAAASLCESPIGVISLVDSNRLWFKSSCGLPLTQSTRKLSFCDVAIQSPFQLLEVEDARQDERFCDSPLVTGDLGVRFYAGVPLRSADGHAIGTLCVIDHQPRHLSDGQRDGLEQLAITVIKLLEERLEQVRANVEHIASESEPNGVMITDASRSGNPITYVNEAFEQLTGYSVTEVIGKSSRFLQGPGTDADSVAKLAAAIAERRSCTVTLRNYRKDGREFWNDLTITPVKDSTGQTISFVGVLRDASERFLARDRSLRLLRTRQEREHARDSRNRLAQIVEDSSNEIYVVDARNFRLLNANRAARENLGYTQQEALALKPWDFIEGVTRENSLEMVAGLKSRPQHARVVETIHRRKDGSTYPASVQLQYMGAQNPPVFTAIVQDISEQQRQEENVRLRERAIEAVDVGVTIIDAAQDDNALVYVNQTLCNMTGYAVHELIGQSAGILQKDNHQHQQHKAVKTAMAAGESVQVLFDSTRKDGSTFKNELSLSPVHGADGMVSHYIGINRDITTKLETEEQLQRLRKIEAIGQLAGGVAHDFNNLLSVIAGNLEFLAMHLANPDLRDYVRKADSAARMGTRLTRRLLSFARQGQLEPTVLDANEHILVALELLQSTIGEQISLTSHLADDLWNIRADASEIENTVVNLVINSRDAMPDGGEIRIETGNVTFTENDPEAAIGPGAGEYIQLTVTDTGTGMDEEVMARVFEPFFTTKETSSGLGLSSIHGFARQSGGDVHISSHIDRGTVIKVYLPAHFEATSAGQQAVENTPGRNNDIRRILVVEDNDMVRDLSTERLQALGYVCVAASDGPEAIRILGKDVEFDLVLTDIVMSGGLSGYDVARWVERHLPRCRILLTSGFNEQMADSNDLDSATLQVLQKPYSLAELQQRINEVAERLPADRRPFAR